MILSDTEIIKKIKNENLCEIDPKHKYNLIDQVGPASLDFRLGNIFKKYNNKKLSSIDPQNNNYSNSIETIELKNNSPLILHPGDFVLGATIEKLNIPENLVARCEGRSSLGRLGLIIHSTAGFIDPWFSWTITLEITNINEIPIKLYPWMRVGQFAFETIKWTVKEPYNKRKGSKYMNQKEPIESRIYKDRN